MWRTPSYKPFTPEGVTLGAWVTGPGISGQVWSLAEPDRRKRCWVVSADRRPHLVYVHELEVIGQAEDEPLFDVA